MVDGNSDHQDDLRVLDLLKFVPKYIHEIHRAQEDGRETEGHDDGNNDVFEGKDGDDNDAGEDDEEAHDHGVADFSSRDHLAKVSVSAIHDFVLAGWALCLHFKGPIANLVIIEGFILKTTSFISSFDFGNYPWEHDLIVLEG